MFTEITGIFYKYFVWNVMFYHNLIYDPSHIIKL